MILLRLVQSALGLRSQPGRATPQQWAMLARHGMLPLFRALGGEPPAQLSSELALQESVCRQIRQRQDQALLDLHDALTQCGLLSGPHPLGLIKGAALGHRLYPQSACRPMADIDLLVAPELAAAIRTTLHQLGYQDYVSPYTGEAGRDHHGAPLQHPRLGVWVEIHTALYPSESPLAGVFRGAADQLQRYTIEGRVFGVLPWPSSFLYVLSHWAQVPQPDGKFHGLIDLALMLARDPQAMLACMNEVQHPSLARSVLVVAALLERCGAGALLHGLDWAGLLQRADFDRFRLRFLAAMAWQLSLRQDGFFVIAGEQLCAQWWVDVLASSSRRQACYLVVKRLFFPHDYGGRRGYRLQRHRLRALWRRLRRRPPTAESRR